LSEQDRGKISSQDPTILLYLSIVISALVVVATMSALPSAQAHQEFEFGQITIEPGWASEPPLVGQLNHIEVFVTTGPDDQPVRNAFANLTVSIQKGGLTKALTFEPSEETAGHYLAEIFPTQIGAYSLIFTGQVEGQTIETTVPIEDVEDVGRLEFPPSSDGGGGDQQSQQITQQLGTIMSDLATQLDQTREIAEKSANNTQESLQVSQDTRLAADRAYMVSMIGAGMGASGIIIAVVLSRRNIV
jgi:hypothetical protein